MTIDEFSKELQENLLSFVTNMNNQQESEHSFPDWYKMFARWLEVGTEMEQEYWEQQ